MGNGVELTPEVVAKRVEVLEDLLTDVDTHYGNLLGARQRQGDAIWTDISSCQGYAYALSSAVGTYAVALDGARGRIAYLQESLQETVRTMTGLDESIQERLTTLANRIAEGPPTGPGQCTIYDIPGAYETPTVEQPGPTVVPEVPEAGDESAPEPPTPEPSPSPSPSPEPTPTPSPEPTATPSPTTTPTPTPTPSGSGSW
ncbi:hypothetical protein [Beutenbergia cavernae]|uniref:hypothetical protein n=1 Tax=Beutenbergia cavernae TaxID=84757 RepID=UPI0002D77171|nr:hypothetical protein [Beutenbergia cavernae]